MNWEEVEEVKRIGHSIGAHGMTHRRLSLLHGDDLETEIVKSGDVLEDRLNCDIPWYAFAFGNIDSISQEAQQIIERRFKYSRSGIRGPNTKATCPYGVLADQVDLDAPKAYQNLVLEGGLDGRYASARSALKGLC